MKIEIIPYLFIWLFLNAPSAYACTTIIVGQASTSDGSIIIARNVDSGSATNPQDMMFHPPRKDSYTFHSNTFYNPDNNTFFWPMPDNTLSYRAFPFWQSLKVHNPSFEETGVNALGVAVSATESISNSAAVLLVDPYTKSSGITEDAITTVVLPQAKSARQGVKILGKIIETRGAGEGFGVAFLDKDEAWYLETASGSHWVAQRIPGNAYFVSANQGRFQEIDFNDRMNVMSSKNIVEFMTSAGVYDPGKGKFNLFDCCMANSQHDTTYNYPRIRELLSLYSNITTDDNDGHFVVFPKASHKLSVQDVASGLRRHYNGSSHDPYWHQNPKEAWRPISVMRASLSHITQIRGYLPKDIATIQYIAFGMTDLSVYIPFYQGLGVIPSEYQGAVNTADDSSLFWRYRKLQALVLQDYPRFAPSVKKMLSRFEEKNSDRQSEMEKEYLKIWEQSPDMARQLIQGFTNTTLSQQTDLIQSLTNDIVKKLQWQTPTDEEYTKLVQEVEKKYHFESSGRELLK